MADDLQLPTRPTLADFQRFVVELEDVRGFSDQSVIDKCLLMGEEVGELFKAVRTREGLKIDIPGGEGGQELADVFIFLCSIANRYGLDLEAEIRAKEEKNKMRVWTGR